MADDGELAFGLQMMEAIQASQRAAAGEEDPAVESSMEFDMESIDSDAAVVLRLHWSDVRRWQQQEADRRVAEMEQRKENHRIRQVEHDRRLAQDLHQHWNVLGDMRYHRPDDPLPGEFEDVDVEVDGDATGDHDHDHGENMPVVQVTEVCTICTEDRFPSEMVSLSGCSHRFCMHCVEKYAAVKVTLGEVKIRCPAVSCTVSFTDEECQRLLSEKSLEMLVKRVRDLSVPAEYKVYCPYRDCSEMMDRRELVASSTSSSSSAATSKVSCVTCHMCGSKFCLRCNVAWHGDMSCETFQSLPSDLRDVEGAMLHTLAKSKRWARCERCGRFIELNGGCYHITCKCLYEFCYQCGKKWIGPHHYCTPAQDGRAGLRR